MNDPINKLIRLGFTAYEAKAYFALLRKHPAIGYEISKISGIPTAKIYETLNSLKNKGAVLAGSSEPVLYYPAEPDMLLSKFQNDYQQQIKDLSVELADLDPLPDIDITWNLKGYQATVEKMKSVIHKAKNEIIVSIWPQEAKRLSEELDAAHRRGVRVIAGFFGKIEIDGISSVNLEPCGITSKKRLGKRLNVAVADSAQAVIGEMESEENTSGLWTTSPAMILTAKEYIRHDIWGSFLIEEIGRDRFQKMCIENELLSYLITTR